MKTFIFAGPSAVGKTYIASLLLERFPGTFEQANLYTTRQPRPGETDSDRIFISLAEFEAKVQKGDFLVSGEFGGNHYGFDHDSLFPKTKHLLVNTWPWLIPQFSKLPHAVIVGMQAPEQWHDLLLARMQQRGDSQETIERRLALIQKDSADLLLHRETVDAHGKYFVIKDNGTIPEEIVPWLAGLLK